MMTYEEARKFIQEASKTGSVLGLESIRNLMKELDNVQDTLPVIHIAGTNGKGSVGAFLYSIFREAGLRVGRYFSPAVFDPLEVWQCDGRPITKSEYADIMSQVKSACDIMVSKGMPMPTVFEIETAAAFVYFYRKQPDVVLLETGMGGETDATNIIKKPLASIITKISFDHMQYLGNTLEEIAEIKAGIIKEGCPVYSAPQEPEVEQIIRQRAAEKHCIIGVVKKEKIRMISMTPETLKFYYKDVWMETSMGGSYQMLNASLAAKSAFHILPNLISENDCMGMKRIARVVYGIKRAKWPGRFEVIGEDPLFILDGAHNEDAAVQLAKTVENCFTNTQITYIIGVLADKEHKRMLEVMLPFADKVFTVTPENQRAFDGRKLAREAGAFHSDVTYCACLKEAVERAVRCGKPVLAFGSLSYLGQLKKAYDSYCQAHPVHKLTAADIVDREAGSSTMERNIQA